MLYLNLEEAPDLALAMNWAKGKGLNIEARQHTKGSTDEAEITESHGIDRPRLGRAICIPSFPQLT